MTSIFEKESFKKAETIRELNELTSKHKNFNLNSYNEWRNVRTLLNDNYMSVMLNEMNIDKEQFAICLDTENIVFSGEKKWLNTLNKILSTYEYNDVHYDNPEYNLIYPFVSFVERELHITISKISNFNLSNKVIDTFLSFLSVELFNICGKVLALELHKYKQYSSDENYAGNEKFKEFAQSNFSSKEGYSNFLVKYPTLARILTVRTFNLLNFFDEILIRVNQDHDELSSFLNSSGELSLENINLSTGDSHNKGKAVCILNFKEGKIVYKPKNLKINKEIDKFCQWFTKEFNLYNLEFPKGIYKKEYSYIEFIEFVKCKNTQSVAEFYTRYGYLICLTYILGITDIHVENIIAKDAYPVIVDIETSFQNEISIEDQGIYYKVYSELESNSVKCSCLLPRSINIGMAEEIDLGALNGKEKKMKEKFTGPVGINTDNFHYDKVHEFMSPGGNNIPQYIDGEEIDYNNYIYFIVKGFSDFIETIKKNKESVLDFLNNIEDHKIRILIKGTEKYASMLRYANHPNYNKEMKYRERLFMNMWAYPYNDKRPIISEVNDLLFNDIPIFESYIKSKDLWDSSGKKYSNYFKKSGFQRAIERIESLDESEVKLQESILLTTLGTADTYLNKENELIPINNKYPRNKSHITVAQDIADNMIKKSIRHKGRSSFLTLDCDDELHWNIVPIDESLYNGLSGVAVFYLTLYIKTENKKYYTFYENIMKSAIEKSELMPIINAFQGRLSPLYPILIEKKYLGTDTFIEYVQKLSKAINKLSKSDLDNLPKTDYISGLSGIFIILENVQKIFGNSFFKSDILQSIYSKIENSIDDVEDIGIAHGISGLVFALAKSQNSIKLAKYLQKENKIYLNEKNKMKWCKGLTGMIQVRIRLQEKDPKLVDEKEFNDLLNSFENTLSKIITDDCLCHGNVGIMATLKMLYVKTEESKWKDYLYAIWNNISGESYFNDYKIPKIKEIEDIGLFGGLSGIGWGSLFIDSDFENVQLLEI